MSDSLYACGETRSEKDTRKNWRGNVCLTELEVHGEWWFCKYHGNVYKRKEEDALDASAT